MGAGNLITQAAGNAIDAGMGIILGSHNDRRQLRQQRRLQELQMEGSKEITDYEYMKQMEMWEKTNYGAQVAQMKGAGINPGLLYGMSGGGATTVGTGGASVQGADAPKGGREVQDLIGMGLQRTIQASQAELMKAQAENLNADTANKKGIQVQEAQSRMAKMAQETANLGLQKEIMNVDKSIKEIQKRVAEGTAEADIEKAYVQLNTAVQNYRSAAAKANVDEATQNEAIKIMEEEAIGAGLKNMLTKANTKLAEKGVQVSDAQIAKMAQDIAQGWQKIKIEAFNANTARDQANTAHDNMITNKRNADTNEKNAATQAWKAAMDAGNPAIWNVLGGEVQRTIESIWNVFGKERPQYKVK